MSLLDDTCDGCGNRYDPMGDPFLKKHPEIGYYAVYCWSCEEKHTKKKIMDKAEYNAHYMVQECECVEGPYIGTRNLGVPDCCERCGRITPDQMSAIREMVRNGLL